MSRDVDVSVIMQHEVEMTGMLLILFVAVVYLCVRRWGKRGWLALIAIFPFAGIWLVAYILVGFSGPWCSRGC